MGREVPAMHKKILKMKKKEIWKDIPEFEGIYQASNFGRLRTIKSDGSFYLHSLKASSNRYINVCLSVNSIRKTIKIHRIVAKLFIPNPDKKPQVNHKDFDKTNNNVENLEWVTEKENIQHALKSKPEMVAGMIKYNCEIRPKKIIQKDLKGNEIAVFNNSQEAHKATGVCRRNILQVASKTEYKIGSCRKQAGGYMWEYAS